MFLYEQYEYHMLCIRNTLREANGTYYYNITARKLKPIKWFYNIRKEFTQYFNFILAPHYDWIDVIGERKVLRGLERHKDQDITFYSVNKSGTLLPSMPPQGVFTHFWQKKESCIKTIANKTDDFLSLFLHIFASSNECRGQKRKKAAKVLHASKEASDHDLADKNKSKAPQKNLMEEQHIMSKS